MSAGILAPGTCPTEVTTQIISRVVAQHIHDLVVGTVSVPWGTNEPDAADNSAPNDNNPVAALLRVSFQFRQITHEVLSDVLGLELKHASLGRLTSQLWTRILSTRLLLTNIYAADVPDLDYARAAAEYRHSPLLAFYITSSLLKREVQELLDAQSFPLSAVPWREMARLQVDAVRRVPKVGMGGLCVHSLYRLLSPMFQDVVTPQLQEIMAQVDTCAFYHVTPPHMKTITIFSDLLRLAALWYQSLASFTCASKGSGSHFDDQHALEKLPTLLAGTIKSNMILVKLWRDPSIIDRAIGVDRLSEWCDALQFVVKMTEGDSRYEGTKILAASFLKTVSARLEALNQSLASSPGSC